MNIKNYGRRAAAALLALSALCLSSCRSVEAAAAAASYAPTVTGAPETRETRETFPVETIMAVMRESEDIPENNSETDEENGVDAAVETLPAAEATTSPKKETTSLTTKEKPITNRIYLQGPNLVYVGESFDYTYLISSKNKDRATVLWSVDGDAGTLSPEGVFTAEKSGTVTLTVSDISNGLTDSLEVHCVTSPAEVDFIVKVNGIPIANKTYPVPKDYMPGLDPEVEEAFMRLFDDAQAEDINITFNSGFRSYGEQMSAYKHWTEKWGSSEEADRVSARPGHSEHQLGLAIDVCNVTREFAETPEAAWLAENCYKYGFILRYPSYESEAKTGYAYEPWHIRYLGEELAADVAASGLTLEEYLGIDSRYRIELFEDEVGVKVEDIR